MKIDAFYSDPQSSYVSFQCARSDMNMGPVNTGTCRKIFVLRYSGAMPLWHNVYINKFL